MADEQTILTSHFSNAMAAFAPFERQPHLAVGCSGGPDSMALALLAHQWTAAQGGRVTALIVDHQLRPESATEAALTVERLRQLRIAAHILKIDVPLETGNLMANARTARYAALSAWCRQAGVLHLLVGHQAEDQAETCLFRLLRRSGLFGLSGMAACAETVDMRVLRPLLHSHRADILRYLAAKNCPFVEDPSNNLPIFQRVRLRRFLQQYAPLRPVERLCAIARTAGQFRAEQEASLTRLYARYVWLHPAGFVWVDAQAATLPPCELAALLARLLVWVSGRADDPRFADVEGLAYRWQSAIAAGKAAPAATLHHCRMDRWRRRGRDGLAIYPETRHATLSHYRLFFNEKPAQDRALMRLGDAHHQHVPDKNLPARMKRLIPALALLDAGLGLSHIKAYSEMHNNAGQCAFLPAKPIAQAPFFVM